MDAGVLMKCFLMIFIAEMGDKSQFLMAAMTAHYRVRDILAGALAAIALLNLLAVTLGGLLGRYLPPTLVAFASAAAFFFFAGSALLDGEESEKTNTYRAKHAPIAVFCAYFLAELGDKTQLSAMALAAEGRETLTVFLGATAGLFLSGLLGLFAGKALGNRLPSGLFSRLSALLFFICGVVRLLDGTEGLFSETARPTLYPLLTTTLISVAFASLCVCAGRKKERKYHAKTDASGYQSVSQQRYE